ncbi:hypothetical protein B9Z65_3534 [Elsinoe australis]|uniref:C2H2-type domain-containing protein n=1 Tax=Elsinoe australis TaxID=40998 RepID=A0A2P8AFH8_9PEZI|nr:hypothetical protein B9Z65_3534 [Elsinoe australis]
MANNYNWNGNYASRQQPDGASYAYPNNVNSNSQYGGSSTATYQTSSYQQHSSTQANAQSNAAYGRQWNFQPSQTESRAAETLSTLSTQETAPYGSNQNTYGSGTWDSAQRPSGTMAHSTTATQSYDNSYASRSAQPTYTAATANQSNTYSQHNSYLQNTRSNTGYQRTTQNYNPVDDARSTASPANYMNNTSTASPRIQQKRTASPVVSKNQVASGFHEQRPSTSGHSRIQSVTPTQLQQQARNAPPPQSSAPSAAVQATIDPTQVYDPWPEQKRAAERAAEERKRREAEQVQKKAAQDAADRERMRKEDEAAAAAAAAATAEREKQAGIDQAKAMTASALDAAHAAASSGDASIGDAMEAEMRAMFSKMRQFNAANPKLLAKLWEEERQAHATKPAAQVDTAASASAPPPTAPTASAPVAGPSTPIPAAKPTTSGKNSAAKKANSSAKVAKAPRAKKGQATAAQATQPAQSVTPQPPASSQALQHPAVMQTVQQASPAPVNQTSAPAPPPPPSSQGPSTIWPPGRKQLLAETGANWLNSRKQNDGKHITADRLAELLNGNPSYPNLCASIEAMGLFLDRSAFARTLLTAVPDLDKSSATNNVPPQSTPTANAPPTTFGAQVASTSQQPGPIHTGIAPEAPMVNGVYRPQQAPAPLPAPPVRRPPMPSHYLEKFNNLGRPLTKEENARKRVFETLIDLNNNEDDSDNDMPRPPKIQNSGQYDHFPSTISPSPANQLGPPQLYEPAPFQEHLKPHKQPNPRLAELKNRVLVQPLLRERAARRSTYDPRTIARDILLATGRHPEMRPLNGHLMSMQGLLSTHSLNVEMHKYDLGTLRWDLIDPGDPLPDSEDEKSDNEGSQADDESDSFSTSALARPTVAPTRIDNEDGTITVAVSQPTLKGMGKIKKRRGRPPRQSAPGGMQTLSGGDNGNKSNNDGNNSNPTSTPGPRKTTTTGRPVATPGSAPQQSGNRSGTPSGTPTGYAAFRAQTLDANGNPVKKKGRPVGWRKSIHSKEAQGLLGQSGPSSQKAKSNVPSEMKRRGRPPLNKQTEQDEPPPEPKYNVYKCHWQDCGAELHNLDTLRKHVIKIHGSSSSKAVPCLWGTCGLDTGSTDAKGKGVAPGRYEFPDIHKWVDHIEHSHLLPLARSLGDGPRSGLSDAYDSETSQAYLSDASGRIITPRATPLADVAEEEEAQGASLAPILRRGMPRVRGRLSTDQMEDENKLQQLEAKKLILGPIFDKSGSTLATDQRRKGLYDDEDFEAETDADDGPEWGA